MAASESTQYPESGFLLVPGFFAEKELGSWRERLRAILAGEAAPAERMLVMRDVMVAKGAVRPESREHQTAKLQDFENDPVLRGYLQHPRLLDSAAGKACCELVNDSVAVAPRVEDGLEGLAHVVG